MGKRQVYNPVSGEFDFINEEDGGVLAYIALLSQDGTDDPVVEMEILNTLGETLVWERDSVGYYFTQSLLFTQSSIAVNIQKDYLSHSLQIVIPDKRIYFDGSDVNGGYVSVQTQGNDVPADDLLNFTAVFIYVKI